MSKRKQQNEALKDIERLPLLVEALKTVAPPVIVRDSFSSGKFVHPKVERDDDPEAFTSAPDYGDPTGEQAISTELVDSVSRAVQSIADHIHNAVSLAKNVLSIVPADVEERALRNVPDCLACGDPCHGRVISGFCRRCYDRWVYLGRPERHGFIRDQRTPTDESNTV